jgi:hypothetical protein
VRVFVVGLIAAALAAGAPAFALNTKPLLRKPYAEARATLIKMGLKPVPLKHTNDDLFCYESFCKQHPEALGCSGTGQNYCRFTFIDPKDKQYWVVLTHGEEVFPVDSVTKSNVYDLNDIRDRL